jgi:hypothetical protein
MGRTNLLKEKECIQCGKQFTRIYKQTQLLCAHCTLNKNNKEQLAILEATIAPKSNYNRYLFDLYLKYICRINIYKHHVTQASKFKNMLESTDIAPIGSWSDINRESNKFSERFHKQRFAGCPFIKVGHMLQELGILLPKTEEIGPYLSSLLSQLPNEARNKIEPFIEYLRTTSRRPTTIYAALKVLKNFSKWIISEGHIHALTANPILIQKYLAQNPKRIEQIFYSLNMYYHWCEHKKMIIVNPCKTITINKFARKVTICSDFYCDKLMDFIKDPSSDPEQALTIALILIWGFKIKDLCFAKVEFNNYGSLDITLRRIPLGRTKYYNREQSLKLPMTPKWFYQLQKRFCQYWNHRYSQLPKTYPHKYLILPSRNFVRPLSEYRVLERIYRGTIAATGMPIPALVLRKTCGHLHTIDSDASILSRLGWASSSSFNFTWVPRTYFNKIK